MANWAKLLAQMVADPDPRNYTYADAVRILKALGFARPAGKRGGSHRVWRRADPSGNVHRTTIVTLVEKGHGTIKPVYIRDMVAALRDAGLLPDGS
ncbi:MAG: type II toxin-antitoxin system HicA family toxin [Gemmatimonas sp.]|nr:type II toxin-antitoxin system HicA family toxin [Gemmatimonas sp.]